MIFFGQYQIAFTCNPSAACGMGHLPQVYKYPGAMQGEPGRAGTMFERPKELATLTLGGAAFVPTNLRGP